MPLPWSWAPLPAVPRARRTRCSPLSSWQSMGVLGLALSHLISFYFLIKLAGRREHEGIDKEALRIERYVGSGGRYSTGKGQDRLSPIDNVRKQVRRRADDILSTTHNLAAGSKVSNICVPQQISAGQCSNEMGGVSRQQELRRETCAFDLDASDVVFGVWHSLATESRLQPLLDTWGADTNVVLLASTIGVRDSVLFEPGMPGSKPHLLDTGIPEDDYFSTLGKAFIGLRLMFEAYPSKKWFVVLGDDNYVLMENYINVLSAFDPEQPWALSRIMFREKFGCKVAGGASVITSRAMTKELSPHLEPWYQGILERSDGDVTKASEADKFHDIAFQKLVEAQGHTWVHLDELPHQPPGFYFHPRLAVLNSGSEVPARAAIFHYVPGRYMHYLHFVSSQACTCALSPADKAAALSEVGVGVYARRRRLSKLDAKRIAATWGQELNKYTLLEASGPDVWGLKGDVERIRELVKTFPDTGWLLLLPVEHYVVPANLAVRIQLLEERKAERGGRGVMISGPGGRHSRQEDGAAAFDTFVEFEEGALLLGRDLANTILGFGESLSGGVFPTGRRPGDREIYAWARTINRKTVLEDPGLLRRLPDDGRELQHVGCPAVFPMDPDLADLKPEFTISEEESVMPVTKFLLSSTPDKTCTVKRQL